MKQAMDRNPVLVWDTYEIAKAYAEHFQEEENLTDDEAFAKVCEDDFQFEWEWMVDELTEIMDRINPDKNDWVVDVSNFGWRSVDGHGTFQADNGRKFLQKILPDTECSFKIYVDFEKRLISINNAHHDSPVWKEWYYISIDESVEQ